MTYIPAGRLPSVSAGTFGASTPALMSTATLGQREIMSPELRARTEQVVTSSPKKANWLEVLTAGWGARPKQQPKTAMPAASIRGGLPPWVAYAAAGGLALVLVAQLGRKRK